ncbi:MAG TPA: tricarballylate utilization 4Fe-4S protein TcuB [Candidatus Dormibacteraeota bacterium]|nr:tricarballylate utilization 4Fe-4S protein TcuB [Candidatus Dormibacteraeota bacterium]
MPEPKLPESNLPEHKLPEHNLFDEANRQLVICNACRYCEGFCPVFRAIETRRDFHQSDVFYLSNLCHDCRACYYACMFTPPHEFAINIPTILAEARMETYRRWSWPGFLAQSFKSRGITVALAGAVAAVVMLLSLLLIPADTLFSIHTGAGAFYAVVPYLVMVVGALVLFFYALAIWMRGGSRCWSETRGILQQPGGGKALARAAGAALGLRYLKGGGPGCPYPDERPSGVRRLYHSLTVWGFALDFLSTTLAFIYQDFFHVLPPYSLGSAPVIFGGAGGVALIVGAGGLIWLKLQSDEKPAATGAKHMDYVFLGTLGLVALTGMLTLILRATSALGIFLVLHLACVAALFATAPYGKFVHFVYRTLALIRYEIEQSLLQQSAGH